MAASATSARRPIGKLFGFYRPLCDLLLLCRRLKHIFQCLCCVQSMMIVDINHLVVPPIRHLIRVWPCILLKRALIVYHDRGQPLTYIRILCSPIQFSMTYHGSKEESEGSVNTLSNTFYIIFNSQYFQWHIAVVGQSQRVVSILFQILFYIKAELDDSSRQQHPHPAVIFALALYNRYEYIHHVLTHGLIHSLCFDT